MVQIDPFLDYLRYERNYSDQTVEAYRSDIIQFWQFAERESSDLKPEDVKADQIRDWMVELMDMAYTPTSVNRKLSSLRAYYRFLKLRGELKADPLRKIEGPKKRKPLPTFLREEEMDVLLDRVNYGEGFKGCRDRLVILMFYATGIRLSELVGLDNSDVDFSLSVIKVTGKRNKQRLIPFDSELKREMEEYVALRDETLPHTCEAFFVREGGGRITRGNVATIVRRNLSKVVTVKKRSPHVLRHTFATVMLNHQAELEAVKELLGHESLATTEVYTHTTFEELKKVYNQAHPRA